MKYVKNSTDKTDSFENTDIQKKFIFPKDQYTQITQEGSKTIKTLSNRNAVLVNDGEFE